MRSIPSSVILARNSTSYCYSPPTDYPSINDLLGCNSVSYNLLSPKVRAVLQVSFVNLSRISEVLSLTVANVLPPDRVFCKGSKKGSSYLIFLPGLSSQLARLGSVPDSTLLFGISYMQCYRGCLRAGIRLQGVDSVNTPRTHLFRYVFAKGHSDHLTASVLRDLLHHRSINSQLYYINK